MFHLSEADAGEFYLYAFEKDRIFQRIRTFEGRNTIQFTTYLSFYVLRDLLLEWLRTRGPYTELLSLEAPIGSDATESDAPQTLGQRLAGETATPEEVLLNAEDWQRVMQTLEALEPEKRLLLKLLSLAELDLEPNEIRLIAQLSGRGIGETLQVLEEIGEALGERARRWQDRQGKLASTHAWIMAYQWRLRQLEAGVPQNTQPDRDVKAGGLLQEREELERKLAWRYRQQASLRREVVASTIRHAYRDIARLLNWPLGTVCSKIARAREELWRALGGLFAEHSSAGG